MRFVGLEFYRTVTLSYKRYGIWCSLELICCCCGCFQRRRSCLENELKIEYNPLASKYDRKLSKHALSTLSLLYFVEIFYSAHRFVFNRSIRYGTDGPSL